MPTIRLPAVLRSLADGAVDVRVTGDTVAHALDELVAAHPGIEDRIMLDGGVAPWLNVFVGVVDVRARDGLATGVAADDVVTLVPAVAGG